MVTNDEARTLLIKQTRRDILTTLKMFYPACSTFETLRLTLPTVEEDHLRKDVSYLIAKRYVQWINERANAPWATREYTLTAVGVEKADGIDKDPALEP